MYQFFTHFTHIPYLQNHLLYKYCFFLSADCIKWAPIWSSKILVLKMKEEHVWMHQAKATPNKFSVSRSPLRHICMRAGSPFHYFITRLAAIIYQVIATANSQIEFLACAFISYSARITQTSLHGDLLAHWHMNWQLYTKYARKTGK